eukprot:Gregarina_sp_Poly_1__8648@NODE_514_length_7814_cov_141_108300_g408_i0_p3_GENE_NODE_514_length_7814_cov_141_108300_g408_i0NODE_514_length_7814_cov_141_108300_g408_i0_p3_ORF_typecomplete_len535_score67_94COesterase/PF00135_28/1e87Abhydrolase_3/PF07859_13/1_2e16Chlorophyllase2/PF12740_7/1_1e06Esterase_phd/PF10503_9/1_7e05Esterase/PF00756_20/4e05Peptidase_S9/PF00326_21/2_3e05Chlorophyllase/PF07224_11/5_1e05PAFAH_p_II/PF03403_13/0_0097Abhydrolase_2/PF02230_16/0_086Say1_Mug180/PF10340_9/0_4_NODE_514_l
MEKLGGLAISPTTGNYHSSCLLVPPDGGDMIRATGEGQVLGTVTEDQTCWVWASIPYGSIPPGGAGRFRRAQPPPQHPASVLDCTRFSEAPVSIPLSFTNIHSLPESDDALSLNIYVPIATPATARLPVLVWIHGGAFASGAGAAYGGEYLAAEGGIVVVTINYRLGVFGFLNLKSVFDFAADEFDSNVGVADQLAALKWIKSNIHNFHGDPESITIAGSAAGGACVTMHLTNEESKSCFHRAIMHSGCLSMCDELESSREKAARYVSLLRKKCGKNSMNELKELLISTDSETLQDLLTEPIEQSRENFPIGPWFGCPGAPPNRQAALAALPRDKGILVGYNRDEANLWLVLANAGGLPLTKAAVDQVMQRVTDEDKRREIAALYPRDMTGITNFATDVVFANTTRLLSDCLARVSVAGVWRYRVDEPLTALPQLGSVHGQELPRLWRMPGALRMLGTEVTDPAAEDISRRLRAAWCRFIKEGSPGWESYKGANEVMVFESALSQSAPSGGRVIVDHESIKKVNAWRGLELVVW